MEDEVMTTQVKNKESAQDVVNRLLADDMTHNDPVVKELVKEAKYRMILGAINNVESAFSRSSRTSVRYGNTRRILRDLSKALDDLDDLG